MHGVIPILLCYKCNILLCKYEKIRQSNASLLRTIYQWKNLKSFIKEKERKKLSDFNEEVSRRKLLYHCNRNR